MVCSSGVTPAAVIFTSTRPSETCGLGMSDQLQILVTPESFGSHCAHDFQFLLFKRIQSLGRFETFQPPPRALISSTVASMRRRWISVSFRSFARAAVCEVTTWR